ncbi:hypothetical protein KCH_10130 [Kitasatospora cheerisanensis KCTC 2395]|uniref:Uncharacterized protein n=1 Tax=Kitasatospora cheerisanensis KCTC 2395 TaxID=1348663 RepID=A0A066Z194_9ACTN|nr:hypothetical protein KCH_10130 [Kitasatospora cheerisanensis KCTC 2395]
MALREQFRHQPPSEIPGRPGHQTPHRHRLLAPPRSLRSSPPGRLLPRPRDPGAPVRRHAFARGAATRAVATLRPAPLRQVHVPAPRRRADPAGRAAALPQQHRERQTGRGDQPLVPRYVVVPVQVRVPADRPAVSSEPQRPGALAQQAVERGGGTVGVGCREHLPQQAGGGPQRLHILPGDPDGIGLAMSAQNPLKLLRAGVTGGKGVDHGGSTTRRGRHGGPQRRGVGGGGHARM